jgi:NADH-quinone oxidoreductase subunit J
MLQVYKYKFTATTEQAISPVIQNIGDKMLSVEEGGYALPFEVISMLLLAALVGCIVIAMRSNKTETVQTV